MNKIIGFLVVFGLLAIIVYLVVAKRELPSPPSATDSTDSMNVVTEADRVEVVAKNLEVPWAIAFLRDGKMLVTERRGTVQLISKDGKATQVAQIKNVKQFSESGLHGIALHPKFEENRFVYLYYTYGEGIGQTLNRVVRMSFDGNSLKDEKIIVDKIPGAPNHDGGRIKFGPDGFLYITTGDAQEPSSSQEENSLAGKILRVTDEGSPAPGNPFENSVYSYGHRNPQGITWDESGNLWETEHGPSGGSLGTGNDEINKIESGKNYGWPTIQGDQTKEGMETPLKNSTKDIAWAPAGAAFIGNSLFFGGLRGQTLYEAVIQNGQIIDFKEHLKGEFGRIREVIVGPDNMLYMTTSNRDGRGFPKAEDDKILKINPTKL